MTYYEAGFCAYNEGRSIRDNEYSPSSHAWEEWRRGWNEAHRQHLLNY